MRFLVALTAVVILSASSCGCRMCADPYDYCQPTFTGEYGQQCCPTYRAGSVLTPNCPGCEQCGHIAPDAGCSDCGPIPAEAAMFEEPYTEPTVAPAPAARPKPIPRATDQSSARDPRYQAKPVSYDAPGAKQPSTPRRRPALNAGARIDAH